jgi:hypothetical protein
MIVLLGGFILIPRLLYPPLSTAELQGIPDAQTRIQLQQAQSQLAGGVRSDVLQAFAGLLVVVGAAATWWQVHISRQGQITERFTRAVDQLGSENIDVRIGGIYALERIAKNSAPDRNAIQFLLAAFVRNHASWPVGAPDGPQHPTPTVDEHLPWMRVRAPDIQTAMRVLGRRQPASDERALYLSRVDLRSVALDGSRLSGAKIRHANLARAVLIGTRLDRSDLTATDLRRAHLEEADLTAADLRRAFLQSADLRGAHLARADLRGTDLSGANLTGAELTGAIADDTTVWPAELGIDARGELGIAEPRLDRSEPAATASPDPAG